MVVESKQFLDMPLTLGGGIRNPSNFIKLSPGVSPTGTWTKSISGRRRISGSDLLRRHRA